MIFVGISLDGILRLGLVVIPVVSAAPSTFEHEMSIDPILFVLLTRAAFFVILIPNGARGEGNLIATIMVTTLHTIDSLREGSGLIFLDIGRAQDTINWQIQG